MKLEEMRVQLKKLVTEARSLHDKPERTKEDNKRFDSVMEQSEKLSADIRREERAENNKIEDGKQVPTFDTSYDKRGMPIYGGKKMDNSGILTHEQRFTDFYNVKNDLKLSNIIRGHVTGDWSRASQERDEMRDIMSGQSGEFGGIVIPNALSMEIIDLARNQSRVVQAGARSFDMDTRSVTIPRLKKDAAASFRGEGEEIPKSQLEFGEQSMKANVLAGIVEVSIEALEDSPIIEETIKNSLASSLALGMDYNALFGDGIGKPLGVFSFPNVQYVDLTGDGQKISSVVYTPFSKAVTKIRDVNGDPTVAIFSARTDGAIDLLEDGDFNPRIPPQSYQDLRKLVTNQVPNDLTFGTSENASCAIIGDFKKLLFGMRTGVTIEMNRLGGDDRNFSKMIVQIRAYMRFDTTLLKPDHFCVVRGILPE